MYDPIWFEHGEYGDTGSYIDTEWYQEALRSGVAKPTPFKHMRSAMMSAPSHTAPAPNQAAYAAYEEEYDYSYDEGYGYASAYDENYGYEEDYTQAGYEDYYSYAPPEPAPRARARAAPRGAVRSRAAPSMRGYGASR